MAGIAKLLLQEQRQLSRALYQVHRMKGFTADYTIIIDRDADPFTTVTLSDVPMGKTALVEMQQLFGGRQRTVPVGGGLFSQEQQPYFLISRHALRIRTDDVTDSLGNAIARDTQYIPTEEDEFAWTEDGTNFSVRVAGQLIQLSSAVEGWVLPYTTIFHEEAYG